MPKPKFTFKTIKNSSAISLRDAAELASSKRQQDRPWFASSSNESSMVTTPAHLISPPNETTSAKDSQNISGASDAMSTSKDSGLINVSSHKNAHLLLPATSSLAGAHATFTKLNRCIIDRSSPSGTESSLSALTIRDVGASLLIVGHVDGATHITSVVGSIIVVSSRQVRMHDCKDVDVYLHCASRPIIEDCTGVRFAQLPPRFVSILTIHQQRR